MMTHTHTPRQTRQQGVALVVVLIFMLALTSIGIFGARNALFGEKMARNMLDAQVAHQAAEAALRDAEQDLKLLEGQTPVGAVCSRGATRPISGGMQIFTADCARGQCDGSVSNKPHVDFGAAAYTAANSEPWWPVDKGGQWNNDESSKPSASDSSKCQTFVGGVPLGTYTGASAVPGVAKAPEYLLERFTRGAAVYFRITARGFGYSVATQSVLQSYFRVPTDL